MHEMAVTQGLLNLALEHAGGQRITDLYLQVGRLSPVVPASVELFFDYLSKGTLAEGARLHFEVAPIEMACSECGRLADLSEWADLAAQLAMVKAFEAGCACGSKRLKVTGGVAFGLVSLTVEDAPNGTEALAGHSRW